MIQQIIVDFFDGNINAMVAEEIPCGNPAAAVFAGEITAVFHVCDYALIDYVAILGK
jgi:hypothetical protein